MNNKIKTILFTLIILMTGAKAYAYDFEVKNADGITLYYNYINNGTELEVTYLYYNYKRVIASNTGGKIVIPKEVNFMNRTRMVTKIGERAFHKCSGLTSITLPNSVKSIGNRAFYNCSELTSITIPNSVTTIEEGAFSDCYHLTSITIPNSVTTIEVSAFSGCSGLTSITIPNSVTTIEKSTFGGCSGLTSITIPNSVTTIGENAFYYCSSLNTITIPGSVTRIDKGAFYGCDLTNVISLIENPFAIEGISSSSDSKTFSLNTFNNATLYVPKGTIEKYKATEGWKDFMFIEEGDGSGTTPATQKCEKPTISYSNGKLTFSCDTPEANCYYSISDTDIKSGSGSEVQLSVTYNISVYASKPGYSNSETATATLCWIDAEPRTEGITNGVASVRANAVLIQSSGNVLNVQGAEEGTDIQVYDMAGRSVGSARATAGSTAISTTLSSGAVGIVKIGDKAVKVVVR